MGERFEEDPRHLDGLAFPVVEKHDPRLYPGNLLTGFLVGKPIDQVASEGFKLRHRNLDGHDVSIESFGLEDDGSVGHDNADTGNIELAPAMGAKETNPGIVNEGKDGIVAEMSAVVDIGDAEGDFRRKVEPLGKIKLDSRHDIPKFRKIALESKVGEIIERG